MISWDDWLAEEVDPLLKLAQRTSKLAARGGVSDPVPRCPHLPVQTVIFPYRSIFPRDPSPKVIADQGAQMREHKRATP